MNKIEKFVARLDKKQRDIAIKTTEKILSGKIYGLDIKKLKGINSLYRVRVGKLRFLYKVIQNNVHQIIQITNRDDTTYNF